MRSGTSCWRTRSRPLLVPEPLPPSMSSSRPKTPVSVVVENVYATTGITDEDPKSTFMAGVANIAAVSLAIGYPTAASVPHSIANGLKN